MKAKTVSILVIVVLLCLIVWPGYGQKESSTKTTWEYKELSNITITEKTLNELGSQGWELVGIAENISLTNGSGYSHPSYYFKRVK